MSLWSKFPTKIQKPSIISKTNGLPHPTFRPYAVSHHDFLHNEILLWMLIFIFDRLIGPFPFTGSIHTKPEARLPGDSVTAKPVASPGRDMHVSATTVAQLKRNP